MTLLSNHSNNKTNPYNLYKILTCLFMSILLSLTICSVVTTGFFPLRTPLFDTGDVYEINETIYKSEYSNTSGQQDNGGNILFKLGSYGYGISIVGNKNNWKYFCFSADNVNDQTIKITISFHRQKNNVIKSNYQETYILEDGLNIYPVPNNSFNKIQLEFKGNPGNSFRIKKMELREKLPASNLNEILKVFLPLFLGYFIILWFLTSAFRKLKYNIYSWIEVLQGIYILVSDQFRKIKLYQKGNLRKYIRQTCFLLMFVYSVFVEISQNYYEKFKYHLVIYLILILIISVVSIEKSSGKKNWNNPLVWGWFVLCILMCISDFFTPKDFQFFGYGLLIVFGFYIFIWNNMQNPEELISDFNRSVHIFFIGILIFCLLFRPELDSARYSGISKNPSIFALYLVTIGATILGSLDNQIRNDKKWLNIILYIVEGCAVFTLIWKTQSAGPLLCVSIIAFIWLFRTHLYARKKQLKLMMVKLILTAVLCLIPVYAGLTWGLNHIPQSVNHTITFEGESPVAKTIYGNVAYAADLGDTLKETRLGQKFSSMTLSGIFSGRNYYYKTYLRNMNLIGHEDRPVMWGHRRLPHNAVIGIAYTYGIFAAIPYIIMLIAIIERTFKYSKNNIKYASLPFYVCLSSIIMAMSDNVEQPFVWLPWMGLYLMMGVAFPSKAENL